MVKSISQINEKIKRGEAVIVRADEMPEIVEEKGLKKAAEKVDIVTTATFGAMCSSGLFLNFGHSDPPIKMQHVWLNEVEAYGGLAAVDSYIAATQLSLDKGIDYGGGNVIEDLVSGKEITLKADSYGTDCYPTKFIETGLTLDDVNQATLYNPRNCYQSYNAATNSTSDTLYTYMGTLLPNFRNVNFSGAGELNPMVNDPGYRTIGFGTRIFLGGGVGYVAGNGTQHSPKSGFGTLTLTGDLKQMDSNYLKAASIHKYGTSLYVGVGVAIPVIDEEVAKTTSIRNEQITVDVLDYGVPRRSRPKIDTVNYTDLYSGKVSVNGNSVKSSCLTSLRKTNEILEILGDWISNKEFFLSEPVYQIPTDTIFKPLELKKKTPFVKDIMTKNVIKANISDSVETVANILIKNDVDQVPVVEDGKLAGIVTSLDITKAMAGKIKDIKDSMTKNVITSKPLETLDEVSRRLDKSGFNSTPVVDDSNIVLGIITLGDINRIYGGSVK